MLFSLFRYLLFSFPFPPIQEKMSADNPMLPTGKQELRREAVLFCEIWRVREKAWRQEGLKQINNWPDFDRKYLNTRPTETENIGKICLHKM